MKPIARKNQLRIESFSDETVVVDLNRNKAHCLNKTASAVWSVICPTENGVWLPEASPGNTASLTKIPKELDHSPPCSRFVGRNKAAQPLAILQASGRDSMDIFKLLSIR